MWKAARERMVRERPKAISAMSSAPNWMSARLEKNLPTASKKLEMSSPSEARGTRSSLGGRCLEPEREPHRGVRQRGRHDVGLERHARHRGHADGQGPGGAPRGQAG